MTFGNVLYLALSLGTFGLFSAVLGYQSWKQSRLGPEIVPVAAPQPTAHHPVTA